MPSALLTDPTATDRAGELRRQMAEIRCTLRDRADHVVHSARKKADWRQYVMRHPLAWTGAAILVGYLLVPRRTPKVVMDQKAVESAVKEVARDATAKAEPQVTTASWLFGLALPLLQSVALKGLLSLGEAKFSQHWNVPHDKPQRKPARKPK